MAGTDIYSERDGLSTPLGLSVALHGMLFASVLIYGAVLGRGQGAVWGGDVDGGDAMNAQLVSNIPLPRPQVQTENIVANESKGLTQSVPKAEEQPTPEAIPIPDKIKKPPKPIPSKVQPVKPVEPPPNVVPFGQGGPVSGPYGSFSTPNAKGGFGVTGSGGDFGTRYAWYVRQIQQKVTENWYKYEVDPNISSARRVYITFEIDRSGRPGRVQIEQSSGIPSLDISATRALQRIDTFGPLPNDYGGSNIQVEYWFDYIRR